MVYKSKKYARNDIKELERRSLEWVQGRRASYYGTCSSWFYRQILSPKVEFIGVANSQSANADVSKMETKQVRNDLTLAEIIPVCTGGYGD